MKQIGGNRSGKVGVGLAVLLGVLGTLVVGGLWLYGIANATRNEGISREIQLSAQYPSNQNYLSAYVSGFFEQASVAQEARDALSQVLEDAVSGRYDEPSQVGGGTNVNTPLMLAFKSVAEAYPEAGVKELMANFGKLQDYIIAGRAGYRDMQDKLLDQLRSYDTWRKQGIIRNLVLRNFLPSDNLVARIGTNEITGEAARKKMYQIVLTSAAREAYESGTMEPLQVPKDQNKK